MYYLVFLLTIFLSILPNYVVVLYDMHCINNELAEVGGGGFSKGDRGGFGKKVWG